MRTLQMIVILVLLVPCFYSTSFAQSSTYYILSDFSKVEPFVFMTALSVDPNKAAESTCHDGRTEGCYPGRLYTEFNEMKKALAFNNGI